MTLRTALVLASAGLLAPAAMADTIFADNFDAGMDAWSSNGNVALDSTYARSGQAVYMKQTGQVWKTVDTSGYTDVEISLWLSARLLESPDYCFAEYSTDGGNNYSTLVQLGNGQDDAVYRSGLASEAAMDDNSQLVVRFRAAASTADHCYGEDVLVTGTPGSVIPEPDISVNDSLSFGTVTTGQSLSQDLTVSNSGNATLNIGAVSGLSGDFAISSDSCSASAVPAGSDCQLTIDYSPAAAGSDSQTLSISSDDPDTPTAQVSVSGNAADESGGGYVDNYDPLQGSGNVSRSQLSHSQLNGGSSSGLVDMSAFALPAEAAHPAHQLEGRIQLFNTDTEGSFREVKDTFRYTGNSDNPRKHLPPFDFNFVQTGSHLVPEQRGIVLSSHPYWEYILEPGRVWQESGDNGDSRGVLPFAIMQKNSNCVHNGLMSFTYNDSQISDVAYQISSETCLYYQFDMWGQLSADYTPAAVSNADTIKQAHQSAVAGRIETRPISELASDYPGRGINVANFGSSSEVTPANMTYYGVYVDGVHYTGGCETRNGPHPYCDVLRSPSYSTAKSAFASTGAMRLELLDPGFLSTTISDLIPEAAADPEGDWNDVTIKNALDMATGNHRLNTGMGDEGSVANDNGFFLVEDHQGKLDYSVSQWPRETTPGTKFVYHTTDTYLATVAQQAYIKGSQGNQSDIFSDLLVADIWQPIGLDAGTLDTRRTYDSVGMPFGGFGLTFLRDDIIKIARFTSIDHGQVNGQQMIDPYHLDIALFRDESENPLDTGITDKYYAMSFWGLDKASEAGCRLYAPFMSGYGGIQIVMLPNDVIYYYVSDNDEFAWHKAFTEAGKIRAYCQ